jgi:hypothetical protein
LRASVEEERMEHANKQNEDYTDDDLNELMPLHFENLARLENLDGDTVRLDEYLGSKVCKCLPGSKGSLPWCEANPDSIIYLDWRSFFLLLHSKFLILLTNYQFFSRFGRRVKLQVNTIKNFATWCL